VFWIGWGFCMRWGRGKAGFIYTSLVCLRLGQSPTMPPSHTHTHTHKHTQTHPKQKPKQTQTPRTRSCSPAWVKPSTGKAACAKRPRAISR
jgi:hypothetical protein